MNESRPFYWKDHIYTSCLLFKFSIYLYTNITFLHDLLTFFPSTPSCTSTENYTVHANDSSHYTAYSSKTFLQNTIKSITSFHQNYIILWCICTSRPTWIPANKLQCTKLVETLRKHSQASIPYNIYKSVRDRPVNDTLFRVSVDIFRTP